MKRYRLDMDEMGGSLSNRKSIDLSQLKGKILDTFRYPYDRYKAKKKVTRLYKRAMAKGDKLYAEENFEEAKRYFKRAVDLATKYKKYLGSEASLETLKKRRDAMFGQEMEDLLIRVKEAQRST